MSDIRDATLAFEAVKVSMRQNKDGHLLTLAVHPNDTPEDLFRHLVGTRYQVALVALNDEGEPVLSQNMQDGVKAVKMAGLLCRDEQFQRWLVNTGNAPAETEGGAAEGLKDILGIGSRAELKTNSDAREMFYSVVEEFKQALREEGRKGL